MTPLFPGPKYAGPQAERFRIDDDPSPDASLDYCSGCGICTQVCPQGVKVAEINTQRAAKLKENQGVGLRDRILARPTLAGRARHRWRRSPTGPCETGRFGRRSRRRSVSIARRRCRPSWAGRSSGRRAEAPRARESLAAWSSSRLQHQLFRARARREDRRAPRTQRVRVMVPSRTAAVCRSNRTGYSTTRRVRAPTCGPPRPLRARGRRHRRDVDE